MTTNVPPNPVSRRMLRCLEPLGKVVDADEVGEVAAQLGDTPGGVECRASIRRKCQKCRKLG